MRQIITKFLLIGMIVISIFTLLGCKEAQMNPAQFLQNAETFSAYSIFDDNINPKSTYDNLTLHETSSIDTYYYRSNIGESLYMFTKLDNDKNDPILSYFRVSEGDASGRLLGIQFGEPTLVNKNKALGIEKNYSVYAYLKDQGFEFNPEFPIKYSNQKGDDKIHWLYLKKDNIFINYAVHTDINLTLHAYEVGIIDEKVYSVLNNPNEGYNFEINTLDYTILSTHEPKYHVGDYIQINISKKSGVEHYKLYVNDIYIKDFEYNGYFLEAGFYMPFDDVQIEIRDR